MSYFAPYLDSSGLHLPTYEDRLQALLDSYRSIFGQEANLEISSPDYQLLSIFARALDDFSSLLVDLFASRDPAYASGEALDLLLPLHGITRSGATPSSVPLTLYGTPGAVLSSAPRVLDGSGHIWACQTAGIVIGSDGSTTVTALCETPGAFEAPAGTLIHLITQIDGLDSVTNPSAATPGLDSETDAQARSRLAIAASSPAQSISDSIRSAIASVPNLRRCALYINETDSTDDKGIASHSICAVVQGGTSSAIAKAIFFTKPPGIGTHGTASSTVTDAWGVSHSIRFTRASGLLISLLIDITALPGFDEDTTVTLIREAVYAYVTALGVGQELVVPALYAVCYGADPYSGPGPSFTIDRIVATQGSTSTSGVFTPAWNQFINITSGMIYINVSQG